MCMNLSVPGFVALQSVRLLHGEEFTGQLVTSESCCQQMLALGDKIISDLLPLPWSLDYISWLVHMLFQEQRSRDEDTDQ